MVEMATTRVGENMDSRGRYSAQEAFGLVAFGVEETMHRGNHAVDFEAFSAGHVEGAIFQHLDLETLNETQLFAVRVVPSVYAAALQAHPFAVES